MPITGVIPARLLIAPPTQADAGLEDLLDLTPDRCLTSLLPHHLAEALFGKVGSDSIVARMVSKPSQGADAR